MSNCEQLKNILFCTRYVIHIFLRKYYVSNKFYFLKFFLEILLLLQVAMTGNLAKLCFAIYFTCIGYGLTEKKQGHIEGALIKPNIIFSSMIIFM